MLSVLQALFNRRVLQLASVTRGGFLISSFLLIANLSAFALPIPKGNVHAIPAFARKYGMPCSSCHEAWPKLSPFGQQFKDNGYQLGNDRDAPIFQSPAYWPIALRITPNWHLETNNHMIVDAPDGTPEGAVANVKTQGFDYTGMDILTAG